MGCLSFNSGKFLVDVNCGEALLSALTPFGLTAALLFGSASIAAQTGTEPSISTQRTTAVTPLEPGKPIVSELAGGQSHSYRIALATGQYLHAVVEQRGIDVVVTLFGPEGKKAVEVDSPNGTEGPEPLFFIAESTGTYGLEVRALDKAAPAGRYEAKIEELRQATGQDRSRVIAERVFAEAELLRAQGTAESLRQAVQKYEESLPSRRAANDTAGEAITLHNIGSAYVELRAEQKALDFYNQALSLRRAAGDRAGEAVTLHRIGSVYRDLGEIQKTLEYYNRALLLRRTVGDRGGEATTLNNIGAIYHSIGELQKALNFYNEALPLYRAVNHRSGEATAVYNIGVTYDSMGEKQKALGYYNQALAIERALNDGAGEAFTLNGIGLVYHSLGEMQKALDCFNQSLRLSALASGEGKATTLNNMGMVYHSLGENQKALDYFNQALLLERASGDRGGEANTLYNMGALYDSLGEQQKALDYYGQALAIEQAIGGRRGATFALTGMGLVYDKLGEKQKALDYYNQALPMERAIGDRVLEATTLNNIGLVYHALAEKQKALDYYNQALALRRSVGDRAGEANTLANIGWVYNLMGDNQKALDYYHNALFIERAVGARDGEAYMLFSIGYVERQLGNLTAALKQFASALDIVESLRANITRQDLRASYFATSHSRYEFYIDLLMAQHKQQPFDGFDVVALQASEQSRARNLLELLKESHADIRQGVDPTLLERERSVQQRLDAKAELRVRLLNGPHTAEQASEVAKEIESLTTEYQEVEAKIRQISPRYAAVTQPRPISLKEMQQGLDANTVLLEYSLGSEHSYLWLVSSNEIRSFELPGRQEIETVANQFSELLTTPNRIFTSGGPTKGRSTDPPPQEIGGSAEHLSEMLLGPVASQLAGKRLLIVPDGALQYLPFAALPDPASKQKGISEPLIVRHEIVSVPSISILETLRSELAGRKSPSGDIAVLADPVFYADDDRVKRNPAQKKPDQPKENSLPNDAALMTPLKKAVEETRARRDGDRLIRLTGTRREAKGILALVPASKSRSAYDFEASRTLASSGELSHYRYVHFATHGLLDSVHPELSAIVLSLVDPEGNPRDGFLRAHEVYNLNLPAEVVVLSGCQTGLGKDVKGEGLIGLTRGFMYAGAARVVVSLWSVEDDATAELMVSFYRGMLNEGKRPADALRAAQVKMLKSDRWQAPYYWAAFVLQGEWR